MNRVTNLILAVVLMGMTLMPQAYMPCFCSSGCSGHRTASSASCCTPEKPAAHSCCDDLAPSSSQNDKPENRIFSYCMCDEQINPAAIASGPVFPDRALAPAAAAISGILINTDPPVGANGFLSEGRHLSSGQNILLTTCILLI